LKNLVTRTITGVVFVILIIAAVIINRYTFSTLFLVITTLGLWEFYSLVEKVNISPNKVLGTIAGAFLFISNALIAHGIAQVEILLFSFLFLFLVFLFELYRKLDHPFTNVSFTFFGLMYVAVPFSLMNYLPDPAFTTLEYNYTYVLGFFFLIWVNESGAYLVGTAIGKHRLFERVSPKKTWEGTIGGGILCIITASIISMYYIDLNMFNWIIIGLIVVVFSTYGDLFESLFKRSIKAKDSGTILPGHGGILDRFDGVIMATPFVLVYLFWIS
jgi:phosphatidate cytidylyltransferase